MERLAAYAEDLKKENQKLLEDNKTVHVTAAAETVASARASAVASVAAEVGRCPRSEVSQYLARRNSNRSGPSSVSLYVCRLSS